MIIVQHHFYGNFSLSCLGEQTAFLIVILQSQNSITLSSHGLLYMFLENKESYDLEYFFRYFCLKILHF